MKIVIINGSPRINGSTSKMLHIMENQLKKKSDVTVYFYDLASMELKYCTGCCYCFKSGKCIMNDDLENLSKKVALADGIIIGSPTYASNISGQLKTFIDRGHLVIEQGLFKKHAIGIITGENYGSQSAANVLRNVFSFSGAYITSMIKYKLPFSNTPKITFKATKKLNAQADCLYRNIQYRKQPLLQRVMHYLIFNFGIKPFVLKKGSKYQGVIHRWEETELKKAIKNQGEH